nr:hypothetical protein [uncultured Ralstonia sp.]
MSIKNVRYRGFLRNSIINLIGGGLMTAYGLLLPFVLSRLIGKEIFSAYILGVQTVPFLLLLMTPVQASLTPRHAMLAGTGVDSAEVQELLKASLLVFVLAALLAISLVLLLVLILPFLLGWNASFTELATRSIAVLGVSTALTFPMYSVTSLFSGNGNFIWENVAKCLGPYLMLLLSAITLAVSCFYKRAVSLDIILLLNAAAIIAGAVFVGYRVTALLQKGRRATFSGIGNRARGLVIHASGVMWMQLCALLTVGLSGFIVSKYSTEAVAPLSMANALMVAIAGVSSALSGPFSVKIAQKSQDGGEVVRELYIRFQRYFLIFLFMSSAVILLMPLSILEIWVGKSLAADIKVFIPPIVLAHLARQMTAPYTSALLGFGIQHRVWLSPFVEAVTCIVFSFVFASKFGGVGVPYGLLLASIIRLMMTIFYDFRITRKVIPLAAGDLIFPFVGWHAKERKGMQ